MYVCFKITCQFFNTLDMAIVHIIEYQLIQWEKRKSVIRYHLFSILVAIIGISC